MREIIPIGGESRQASQEQIWKAGESGKTWIGLGKCCPIVSFGMRDILLASFTRFLGTIVTRVDCGKTAVR